MHMDKQLDKFLGKKPKLGKGVFHCQNGDGDRRCDARRAFEHVV